MGENIMCNCKVITISASAVLVLLILSVSMCLKAIEALHKGIKHNWFLKSYSEEP